MLNNTQRQVKCKLTLSLALIFPFELQIIAIIDGFLLTVAICRGVD